MALGEDHRLRAFWKRVLKEFIGSKRDEVVGGWRKLHNEELCNLCSLLNIVRMINSRMVK
jgi:hypothetical protein